MTHDPIHFTVTDPRTFDGDCFEVAQRACRQSAALAAILRTTIKNARVMARNAEMERQLLDTGECSAAEFELSAQARKIDAMLTASEEIEKNMSVLATAAGFNPKAVRV